MASNDLIPGFPSGPVGQPVPARVLIGYVNGEQPTVDEVRAAPLAAIDARGRIVFGSMMMTPGVRLQHGEFLWIAAITYDADGHERPMVSKKLNGPMTGPPTF